MKVLTFKMNTKKLFYRKLRNSVFVYYRKEVFLQLNSYKGKQLMGNSYV